MGSPPPSRPFFLSRTHSLPSSRPSSSSSHYASSSSRPQQREPRARRPLLERATSLRASSSLMESEESDEEEEDEGRQDFCRRYLSRRGGFDSEEEDEVAGRTQSGFARWAYFPFTSRPSSRSSSTSSSRPVKPIQSSRPRRPHRRSRSNSTSSLPSAHIRHSLLYSSSSPWSTHPGKTSATLGLITPSLDVLTWSLSLPHPHPSSYPRFKNSHRILLNSHRMYQTSLVLRNRNRSTTSNLAAPTTTLPTYPSPAGSDLTIRPSRPSSTHHPQNIPPSNFYSCSPPPFRSTIIPAFLSSRSSSRSYSSEADDDLAAFHHHPTIPTSYSSYLRAGESSPSSSSGERTPRASRASSRQGSTGGGASWEASPTATRRGGVAPSLSFTASTRASSVASMGSGSSPRDFFSGGGGGRMSSRSRAARREVELGDDEEALSPSPSYLTFGSLKKEGGSSIGGSRVVASTGTKRRDVSLSRAGGVASRRGKPTGAQRPIWR